MEKVQIGATAVNDDTTMEEGSDVMKSPRVQLIFASPGYLLRNPRTKKFYVEEAFRARVIGVLVDKAHVIHEWVESFRKDDSELKTLRASLGTTCHGGPCQHRSQIRYSIPDTRHQLWGWRATDASRPDAPALGEESQSVTGFRWRVTAFVMDKSRNNNGCNKRLQ